MNSGKTTRDNQQNDKKLEQKENQMSGTGLSQTRPLFSFLIVVVKDNFTEINIFFLISHLACTLIYSSMNFQKVYTKVKRFNYLDTDNTFHNTKNTTSRGASKPNYQTFQHCPLHIEVWTSI